MKKDNNKIKKIGAWIAIIILLLACCMPMIFAFGNGEDSQVYFKASLAVAIMVPIMAPPVNSRPSAAVATGLVLWACLAVSTTSLVVAANALIWLFAAVALTI